MQYQSRILKKKLSNEHGRPGGSAVRESFAGMTLVEISALFWQ